MNGFTLLARDGNARRGSLILKHGVVETPCFMPVGTAATVKALDPRELHEIGAQILLSNTYHLWLRPGRDIIVEAGGLHAFMGWNKPILTDSGGFQVFSLESQRKIDEDGVTFQSHIDGSKHRFTPENVVAFQEALGVDIAMALDICVALPATHERLVHSVEATTRWARRCAHAREKPEDTLLFPIVQGGLDEALRARSAAELVELDLPGYAIGGLSVGETRDEMDRITAFTTQHLPEDKPRYLMGVGTVRDLLAAIERGIDMFDCVYPTRCGRNGRAMLRHGDINIHNGRFKHDFTPLDPDCGCYVCATFTRSYLSHLFRAREMLGPRLVSYHNLAMLTNLMTDAREAIVNGRWSAFREAFLRG